MKTIQMLALAGACFAMTATQQISAQTAYSTRFKVPTQAFNTEDPQNNSTATVNNKAVAHFHQTYTNASEEKWVSTSEGSRVRFVSNGIRIIESYNKQGDWTGTIRYLPLNMIPSDIAKDVKRTYSDYKIFFAEEVKTNDGTVHIVKIENNTNWKMLKVYGDKMEIMEDLDK